MSLEGIINKSQNNNRWKISSILPNSRHGSTHSIVYKKIQEDVRPDDTDMDRAHQPPCGRHPRPCQQHRSMRDEVSLLCCSCLVEQTSSPAHVIDIAAPVQLTSSPRQHPSLSISYAHAGSERRQPRPGRSKRERSKQRRTVEAEKNGRSRGERSRQRRTVGKEETDENGRDTPQPRRSPVRPERTSAERSDGGRTRTKSRNQSDENRERSGESVLDETTLEGGIAPCKSTSLLP
jgi:hypothetical protein